VKGGESKYKDWSLKTARMGWDSAKGAKPTKVWFQRASVEIRRLADDTLEVIHFSPRMTGL
jgi:hypothetical protein